jgi:hypothetical protein
MVPALRDPAPRDKPGSARRRSPADFDQPGHALDHSPRCPFTRPGIAVEIAAPNNIRSGNPMKSFFFRSAILVTAMQAAGTPLTAHAGDGSTSKLLDQPTATSPGATAETIAAYKLITSRTLHANSNMIEGQHLGGPGDLDAASGTQDDVFDMQRYRIPSAKRAGLNAFPRLVGARYDANVGTAPNQVYTLDSTHVDQINNRLEGIANTYHPLVAITATPLNPWDPSHLTGRTPLPSDGQLSELALANRTKPHSDLSTPVNRFWADIDTIADGLAKLQDASGKPIPVLFRPFAEYNIDKYYSRGQDPAQFVALWNDVVHYYKDVRGLHNLIYCWEAWTWNLSASAGQLDAWFPVGKVDVVAGSFYFKQADRDAGYFNLQFGTPGSQTQQQLDDQAVFNDLMALAVNNNKPFGATQWAVNADYFPGDNANTLAFMSALDGRHKSAPATAQHMAFVYYWTNSEEANWQDNPAQLVDDARVATVSSFDGTGAQQGSILESKKGSGVGGGQPGATLQTGFSSTNQQYRTILSFAANVIPSTATIDAANGVSLLLTPVSPNAPSPFSVAGQKHCVDAAIGSDGLPTVFNGSALLETQDFSAPGLVCSAWTNDWSTNLATGAAPLNVSAASLASTVLNRAGPTQLRLYFTQLQAGGRVTWNQTPVTGLNTADDLAPQLVFTYTLP